MNNRQLLDAIGQVDEDLLERSEQAKNRHHRPRWLGTVAAALAIVILGGLAFRPGNQSADFAAPQTAMEEINMADQAADAPMMEACAVEGTVLPLASPLYPDRVSYPKSTDKDFEAAYDLWREDLKNNIHLDSQAAASMEAYFRSSIRAFLHGDPGENRVCSPLNVYMALGMLAQVTDGNSRQQILDALGESSMEDLQNRAGAVWNASYRNDGVTNCLLANSLWLREDMSYNPETLNQLQNRFYASAYSGTMGSGEMNQALRDWLNAQTDGKLEGQLQDVELDPMTVLALASTVSYEAKWQNAFAVERTTEGIFHGTPGEALVQYMHSDTTNTYYWGEDFSAVGLAMANYGGQLWLVLPDEGISPEALLEQEQVMDFLITGSDWENQKTLIVELTMPKFDISASLDLRSALKEMNITDVFDPEISDFSALTTDLDDIYLSQARQDVRFIADEEGISAVAATLMTAAGNAMAPEDRVEFTLDRPFLFLLTDSNGLPLFVGIVNSCQ